MSSRARLILLSGSGGSGTSTIVAATVAALHDEGVAAVQVRTAREASSEAVALVESAVGRVFAELGADPVVAETWSTLAPAASLATLLAIHDALESGVDAVVADAGDLREARALVELPGILLRLLDSALTARLAMLNTPAPTIFDALSEARARLVRLGRELTHPATTVRLVCRPDDVAVVETARAISVFALLGVGVDGVIVNKVPRRSDGWPVGEVERAEAAVSRMTELADGVPVWKSTSRLRPVPKGRSAMGPLGRIRVLDAEQLTVVVEDESLAIDIPLAGPARVGTRVGIQGDQLVVAFDDCRRWLDLPPVLRRCRAQVADRTTDGLRVTFVPDPQSWRPAAAS